LPNVRLPNACLTVCLSPTFSSRHPHHYSLSVTHITPSHTTLGAIAATIDAMAMEQTQHGGHTPNPL
jgi:hypothetical protein